MSFPFLSPKDLLVGTGAITAAVLNRFHILDGGPFRHLHERRNTTSSSTHPYRLHLEEGREFFNLFGDVANPNRAVMPRTVPVPGVHEISDIERKFIAAIGIADVQDGAGH